MLDEMEESGQLFLSQMQKRYQEAKDEQETFPFYKRLLERKTVDANTAVDMFSRFFFAGVDTTHHVLAFLILDLARHPESQEKLYQELKEQVGDIKNFNEDHLRLPYLSQFIRESHRYSPPQFFFTYRILENSITLDGEEIPAKTKFTMMLSPIQFDPEYVDEPDKFEPERWDLEQVAKRKGTPKEVLDHGLLAKPFSHGSRMCIGSRVAEVEMKMALSKLALDWKISLEPNSPPYKIVQGTLLSIVPFPKVVLTKRK